MWFRNGESERRSWERSGSGGWGQGAAAGLAGVVVGGWPRHRLCVWDRGRRGPSTAVPGTEVVGVSLINLRESTKLVKRQQKRYVGRFELGRFEKIALLWRRQFLLMRNNDVWDVNNCGFFSCLSSFSISFWPGGKRKESPLDFSGPWKWHKRVHLVPLSRGWRRESAGGVSRWEWGHASGGCGLDCLPSEPHRDVTAPRGSPSPGQPPFKGGPSIAPRPGLTRRPVKAADRHHLPLQPC